MERNYFNITDQPVPATPRSEPVPCPLCKTNVIRDDGLVCKECYNGDRDE